MFQTWWSWTCIFLIQKSQLLLAKARRFHFQVYHLVLWETGACGRNTRVDGLSQRKPWTPVSLVSWTKTGSYFKDSVGQGKKICWQGHIGGSRVLNQTFRKQYIFIIKFLRPFVPHVLP
jgi:hypothetical protein